MKNLKLDEKLERCHQFTEGACQMDTGRMNTGNDATEKLINNQPNISKDTFWALNTMALHDMTTTQKDKRSSKWP